MLFHHGTPTANIKEFARDKYQKLSQRWMYAILGGNYELFYQVHCLFIVIFSQHRRGTMSAARKWSCSGLTGQQQCVHTHMFC